jgi:hypothetical protein
MTHTRFLTIALPVIAIPALVVLLLPENIMVIYVDVIEPFSLLIGSFMALWVSFIYRKQLKAAFIFLSLFLLFYAISIILFLACNPILITPLRSCLEESEIFRIIQAVQFINYTMLLFFCINLLRVINVTKLNRSGWTILSITIVFCFLLAIYPVLDQVKNFNNLEMTEIFLFTMRILDALLVIVLVPVLWLYVQYLKSHQRQSLTFTIIILGIVCATVFDYIFQLLTTFFPMLLSESSIFYTSIPEVLFIYGYLVIAAGLYAHRKQDEWGFNTVDKMLTSEWETAGRK